MCVCVQVAAMVSWFVSAVSLGADEARPYAVALVGDGYRAADMSQVPNWDDYVPKKGHAVRIKAALAAPAAVRDCGGRDGV